MLFSATQLDHVAPSVEVRVIKLMVDPVGRVTVEARPSQFAVTPASKTLDVKTPDEA